VDRRYIESIRFYIGTMSRNVIDLVNELSRFGLIASRRQVDFNGGYVMTTKELMELTAVIGRDHAGPLQGENQDNGLESLKHDLKAGIQLIHIDPWKASKSIEAAGHQTADLIKYCYRLNPECYYEIGTEEQIYKYTPAGLERFIAVVVKALSKEEFAQIIYGVAQSGTVVRETHNTGLFNKSQSMKTVGVCHKFGLLAKEHNCDYLTKAQIKDRIECGVDAFNIAPEFGVIETRVIMEKLKEHRLTWELECFIKMCIDSKKWVKWVDTETNNKRHLAEMCGHYMFSKHDFLLMKPKLGKIDGLIKTAIKKRLGELF